MCCNAKRGSLFLLGEVLQEDLPLRLGIRIVFLPLTRAFLIVPFYNFTLGECTLSFFDMIITFSLTVVVYFFS